jgi:invasion protein IalB
MKIMMSKAQFTSKPQFVSNAWFTLVTLAAVICGVSLHAQGTTRQAEPDPVFVPQAEPGPPAKTPAPVRRAAAKAVAAHPRGVAGVGLNGAVTVTETYGVWTLNCGTDNKTKFCTVMQAQINRETGQRAFAIELRAPRNGTTEGTILMPFGLKLDTGVVLRLDDKDVAQGLHFSTCLAQGCLVPVSFPSASIDTIRRAKTLTVGALSIDNDQSVTFSVVLDGFAAAIDRAIQLVS